MEPSRTALARAVDAIVGANGATVGETRTELALYQLRGADARAVAALLLPAGFTLVRLVDEGVEIRVDQIDDAGQGIELIATKPAVPDDVFPVLTRAGFTALLERPPQEPVIWAEELDRRVDTVTIAYRPWGDADDFVVEPAPPAPSRVVRQLGVGSGISDIGRWLLRDPSIDVSGQFLAPWCAGAAISISKALAQEIEPDGRLTFRGPPPTRFSETGASNVEMSAFSDLQRAAAWVYENPRELENRHGLMAAEVARTAVRDGNISDLASVVGIALEGARIAYEFGVQQQSRDALKSLSDLRKAVSDETAKLSEATRSLASAVMTAAVGNVGLVIARLTLAKDAKFAATAALLVGVALAVYVAVVIGAGWHFLVIQRDLRSDWRVRLYRFLGDDEYRRMVTMPTERAEVGFKAAAATSGLIAVVMLIATSWIVIAAR